MTVSTQGTLNALATMAATTGAHSHSITTSSIPQHTHGIVGATGPTGAIGSYGGAGGGGGYSINTLGNIFIQPTQQTGAAGGYYGGNLTGYTVYAGQALASNMRFDNSNPLQLYAFNKAVPEGETFKDAKDLFVTDFRLDQHQYMIQHYLMWAMEYGEEYTDYGTVLRSNDGCFAAFGSTVTRDHFLDWFERYKEVFFNGYEVEKCQYPVVVPGALNGFYVKESRKENDGSITYLGHNDLVERDWSWITTHCAHQVLRFQSGWFFTHESDAVLFKMKGDY